LILNSDTESSLSELSVSESHAAVVGAFDLDKGDRVDRYYEAMFTGISETQDLVLAL
jgi:hypothetical protein